MYNRISQLHETSFHCSTVMVQRVWTPESIDAWRNERDERRKKQGLKPMHDLNPKDKVDAIEGDKRELIDKEFSILSTQAWEVGKPPLLAYAAPFNGYLLLPKNYRARDGIHRVRAPLAINDLSL